jgi:hypothetical protein
VICYGVAQEARSLGNPGKEGSEMGLFSVRGRLPQPAEHTSPVRLDGDGTFVRAVHGIAALPVRFGRVVGVAIQNTGGELAAKLREARLAAIAATNDARIVAVLLLLAAVALGLEMAASFHLI